jgi:hypothetical protein
MTFRMLIAALAALAGTSAPAQAQPRTILFVGNSFTQGAHSAVARYGTDRVEDLNGDGYGGVPALFATFAGEAKLDWKVSLETQGGKTLGFHYDERRARLDRKWDAVVLQELSTLDRANPGDPAGYYRYAPLLADLFRARNPAAQIWLMATWTRADQSWLPAGHWYGKPVETMALDLRAAADTLCRQSPKFAGVLPVGTAWNRAFAAGVADANPYDGLSFGQVDLWTYDQYHASIAGYYLEALVVFGRITGTDPRTLGRAEKAASDLALDPRLTEKLQAVAADELAVPDSCGKRS